MTVTKTIENPQGITVREFIALLGLANPDSAVFVETGEIIADGCALARLDDQGRVILKPGGHDEMVRDLKEAEAKVALMSEKIDGLSRELSGFVDRLMELRS